MTLEGAKTHLGNLVYQAAIFYERLENAGKLHGNGHHMAQNISAKAQELLEERWLKGEDDVQAETT
jgi:hypothetical protein